MMDKIKKYLEYRKDKKIAKRELAGMAAAALPLIREASDQAAEILEALVYMAGLQPSEIQEILMHAEDRAKPGDRGE